MSTILPDHNKAIEIIESLSPEDKEQWDNRFEGPRVVEAFVKQGRLYLLLTTKAQLSYPVRDIIPLESLNDDDIQNVKIRMGGTILLWPSPKPGVTIVVEPLIEAATGLRSIKASAARGGQARTDAKIAAARANGAKGGRPRKSSLEE